MALAGAWPLMGATSARAATVSHATPGVVYVTNLNQNTVTAINPATHSVHVISGFNGPLGIAITPDGDVAYVTNSLSDTVTPVDLASGTPSRESPIKVGGAPVAIAISADGTRAYVSNFNANTVTPINLTTSPPTPLRSIHVGAGPWSIAVSPSGADVVVSDSEGQDVTVINPHSGTTTLVPIGSRPQALSFAPDGATVYVAQTSGVTPISLVGHPHARAAIGIAGSPVGVAVTPGGTSAITANSDGTVTSISLKSSTARVTSTVAVSNLSQPDGVALSPNGATAYAANASNTVTPIDLRTNPPTPGASISVASATFGIAVAPDQAPVAHLTVTPGRAGQPTRFNASTSTSPDGAIAGYSWIFGDGTSTSSTSPVVTHVYHAGGLYHASVVETSRLGTSTATTFTGQTVSNNGAASAATTASVHVLAVMQTVPSSGPPGIRVHLRDSTMATTCSPVYVLFDGRLIAQAAPSGHVFSDRSVVVPGDASLGAHHLSLSCATGSTSFASTQFTVVATKNHLSEFSVAMPNPRELANHLAGAGGISLGMLLISRLIAAGFPSEWLDSTYEQNRHRIQARMRKRFPGLFKPRHHSTTRRARAVKGTAIFLGFVLAAGAINAVLDPGFGFNRTTLWLFLGQAFGVGVVTMASQLPVALSGVREHRTVHLKVLVGGLVIAIACVSVSRLVGLSPGYCYGLIAVFVLNPKTREEDWGRMHAIASLVLFVVASAAFLLTVPVFHAATSPSPNPVWLILDPALNVIFLGGFASLAFSMFPLPFLPGRHIARWHRGAWLTISGVGMVGFIAVLLSPGSGSSSELHHVAIIPLIVAFVAFALVSLGFMLYFHRHPSEHPEGFDEPEGREETGPTPELA